MPNGISQHERERRQRRKEECQELLASINRLLVAADRAVDNNDYKILKETLELLPRKKYDLMIKITLLWNQPFLSWYVDMKSLDLFMDSAINKITGFMAERDDDDEMTDKDKVLMKELIKIIREFKEDFEEEKMDPYDILY